MAKLLAFFAAFAASVVLYLAVFSVVDRPLTLGGIADAMRIKSDYAQSLPRPKLAVWAGSNGRYSHRCEALSQTTGRPCVNLSLAVGIGIDFQLLWFEPLLQAGDLLYMPLEYNQYRVERGEMESGAENTVLVHQARDILWTLPAPRIARAWASFELPFLLHGIVETGLSHTGFKRRTGLDTMTPQGDERGHTAEAGAAYAGALAQARFDTTPLPLRSHALDVIDAFLERARARGVVVVGGLPTAPDNAPLDLAGIDRLRQMYARHGQHFLVLPNRSQYPLSCFFDSLSHLNEGCQMRHSTAVGQALAAYIPRPPGPAP